MKYVKTFESFKLNESDYIQVDVEKLKNLDLDKEGLFKLLRELIPDDEPQIAYYERKWGQLEDQGKSESECVKALIQDVIIKDVEFVQSMMTDPNERESWKWGNVPDSILLKDEGEDEPEPIDREDEPEPIDHEKEAEKKWDQYWYGDGFDDINGSLHNEDFNSFADHIYTALEILNKTSEYTLDSFKETFNRILTDSFSVLRDPKVRLQHSSLFMGEVEDAIMSIANRVETNNPNIKPY